MDPDAYLCQLADIFNGITVNPPSFSAIVAIVLAGVLLLASGFASASEIAFFSLSPSDLNEIDERNHPSDEKISSLLGDSESLLATVLYECFCFSFSACGVLDFDGDSYIPVAAFR